MPRWHSTSHATTPHVLFPGEFLYHVHKELLYQKRIEGKGKGKVKVRPITGHEGPEGEWRYSSTLSLNLGARWGWVVNSTTRPLYPRERPGTHCVGGWVSPRAGLGGCGKSRLHRDSIPGPSRWIGEWGSFLEMPLDYSAMFNHEFRKNISVLQFTWSLFVRLRFKHQRCEFCCMLLVCFWRDSPQWARAFSFTRFLNHTFDSPQSVGLLWTSDRLGAETSTWQHTTLTTDKHPCPRRDSSSQSQRAGGRRPTP
jgi:hypothetical protein